MITFGICTNFNMISSAQLREVKYSIEESCFRANLNAYSIKCNCDVATLTKKKNDLVNESSFDTVVLLHDYFKFNIDWVRNFLVFNKENFFDIASCRQLLLNGKRHFTDWVTWDHPKLQRYTPLEYTNWDDTKYQYISGGFMIVRKHVIEQEPFNEKLDWGQSEDVEWSLRVRDKFKIKCCGDAVVQHNKAHRDNY